LAGGNAPGGMGAKGRTATSIGFVLKDDKDSKEAADAALLLI